MNSKPVRGSRAWRKAAALLTAFALTGCFIREVPSDGFKAIKFGSTSKQLEAVGFQCFVEQRICTRSKHDGLNTGEDTLLHHFATVTATLVDDKVRSIVVRAYARPSDVLEIFERKYGPPVVAVAHTPAGLEATLLYWLSTANTAVVIVGGPVSSAYPLRPVSMSQPEVCVEYLDATATTEFLANLRAARFEPGTYRKIL